MPQEGPLTRTPIRILKTKTAYKSGREGNKFSTGLSQATSEAQHASKQHVKLF